MAVNLEMPIDVVFLGLSTSTGGVDAGLFLLPRMGGVGSRRLPRSSHGLQVGMQEISKIQHLIDNMESSYKYLVPYTYARVCLHAMAHVRVRI